ncbi:MAG: AgmX/PglI C-terminal domain-containing protein [Polyangiales bacterium]
MTKEPKAETRTAVEIVVLWGDRSSVLAAVHLDPPRDFVLAEDGGEGADFVVAEGTLHGTPHRLVRTEGGRPEVAAPGEQPRAITGDVSLVRVGDLVFRVRSVVPEQRLPAAPLDREPLRYVAATGAVAALFGALVALEPGASGTLSGDQLDLDSRLVQTLLARPEALPDAAPVAAGATLERTAGRSGAAGDESAPERVRRGQRSGRELGGRESTPASTSSVRTAGVLGVLQSMAGSFGGMGSPYAGDAALGSDPTTILGALVGGPFGTAHGSFGLDLHGSGRGVGDDADGTIDTGGLRTRGDGDGDPYGRVNGLCRGEGCRPSARPSVTPVGEGDTVGSIPQDAIRRVVRRHLPEIRFCYEQALESRPDLEGRVTTSFVIGSTGTVSFAQVASSSLGSAAAEQCIASAVRRWTFPAPTDGGIVRVSYPFSLTTAQ